MSDPSSVEVTLTTAAGFHRNTKTCRDCKIRLPLADFHSGHCLHGKSSLCKSCRSKSRKSEYWKNPDKAREKARAQRLRSIDRNRELGRLAYRRRAAKARAARIATYRADPEFARQKAKVFRERNPWASLINSARGRAERKGIAFDLTVEWGASVWTGKCAITGADFVRSKLVRHPFAASIDRVIPSVGYLQGNCRFILWSVNALKGTGSDEIMFEIARLITEARHGN